MVLRMFKTSLTGPISTSFARVHDSDGIHKLAIKPMSWPMKHHRRVEIRHDLTQRLHDPALDDDIQGAGRFVGR